MADYYYSRDGKVKGPIPLAQIVKYVKARKLPAETQVCVAGKKEWKAIASVAPDVANLASNAKIVGMTIGGAVGLILLLMGLMYLFRAGEPPAEGTGTAKSGGGNEEEPSDTIITEFTAVPSKPRLKKVIFNGEPKTFMVMDVDLQTPDPIQISFTPENLYLQGKGRHSGERSKEYYIAPRVDNYELNTESDPENFMLDGNNVFNFDGELTLKLDGGKKHRISLVFFDYPGEDVELHFPPYQPWNGNRVVASNGDGGDIEDDGRRPVGGDPRAGEDGGGRPDKQTIVVGNVPEDFAFMPLSKVKADDIANINDVLAGVQMEIQHKVDTPEEAQVVLLSGEDVVTGLYGDGLRLFPLEAGADVDQWIPEPFAAYRQGTLIAVYDPGDEEFRRPRDEDGVPPTIESTGAAPPPAGEGTPEMTPGTTPEMAPGMTPGATPEMAPAGGGGGATMKPEMEGAGGAMMEEGAMAPEMMNGAGAN